MDPFDTYKHAGVTVELHYDESSTNPREDFDHVGNILSFTHDFDGDEYLNIEEDRLMVECPVCGGSGYNGRAVLVRRVGDSGRLVGTGTIESMQGEYDRDDDQTNLSFMETECSMCEGGGQVDVDNVSDYIAKMYDAIAIPLRFSDYGSSGSQLVESRNDPNAVIYCSAEKIKEEWDGDTEKARECLLAEVEEMDSHLSCEVYGYIIKSPNGEDLPGKFHDSCWGFIGDSKYVREEANKAAECVSDLLIKENAERDDMAARDIETVDA